MKINELEKLLGLSKANIRYYESEGLINPKRTENGYRSYTEEDARLLKKIIVYRKLGISISDIKEVLNNEKTLDEALAVSINNMTENIEQQSIAIDICKEIADSKATDKDFDTDYYWNEIENGESDGEEFVDIFNIDITPFKNRRKTKVLVIIAVVLFFVGIIYSLFCDSVFIRDDNSDYKSVVPEVKTADTIDTVKVDANNGLVYVFYNNASCVNTYDTNGKIKWAISVPYKEDRGITYFYLIDNKLYIDNKGDIYVYNALTGEYIEKLYLDDTDLADERDNFEIYHQQDIDNSARSGITFDIYNVYLNLDNGGKIAFVEKPAYTILQNETVGIIIAFIGGLMLALIIFIGKVKTVNAIKLNKNEISKIAKIHRTINFAIMGCYLVFAVVNIIFAICKLTSIAVGIFPATFLLIASAIVNDIAKKHYNKSELKYTNTAFHYLIIAYMIVFISVLISIVFLRVSL